MAKKKKPESNSRLKRCTQERGAHSSPTCEGTEQIRSGGGMVRFEDVGGYLSASLLVLSASSATGRLRIPKLSQSD